MNTALSITTDHDLVERIRDELARQNAVLVAHYYVRGELQDLARDTGGIVADSLEMARFGSIHPAKMLVVAGVRFMGETAKILSPDKRVLMPDLDATCSLELSCQPDAFAAMCDAHSDRTVVVYANASADVKAQADWIVTSSCAAKIVQHLHDRGERILWAPDRHLGRYVQGLTGADMLIWNGACIVHDEFKAAELEALRLQHPSAVVLAHPEAPSDVVQQADIVGSTSMILQAVLSSDAQEFIIATDMGIAHAIRRQAPHKTIIAAPTSSGSIECTSCARCPWMAMNSLQGVLSCLRDETGEIHLNESIRLRALIPTQRMLEFTT